MATSPAAVSVDSLSKEDRDLVVESLKLKLASVERAARAEANSEVAEIRRKQAAALTALIARFR